MNQLKIFALALFAIFAFECTPPSKEEAPAPAPTIHESPAFERLEDARRALTLSRPHLNATASSDTRNLDQIRVQACTAADGSWRCAGKKPLTFKALGNEPINPIAWLVPAWFIDPQNTSGTASDHNDCVTAATACRTWGEIAVHRFGISGGCVSEGMPQTTTITYLSSHTDNTDPMLWCPNNAKGAVPFIVGAAPASVASVFTLNAAKNTAAGANAMLSGSFSAGAPATGKLLQNTTHSSRAYVYTSAGGANFNITQPIQLNTLPTSGVPAEVAVPWASLDAVNVLTPVQVNLVMFAPDTVDFNGAFDNIGYLSTLTVFDPQGAGSDNVYLGNVYASDVGFQRTVTSQDYTFAGFTSIFSNCFFAGGFFYNNPSGTNLYAGAAQIFFGPQQGGPFQVDGDFIMGVNGGFSFMSVSIGQMFLDGNLFASAGSIIFNKNLFLTSHILYGTTGKTITLSSGTRMFQTGATFTNAWTLPSLITGITLDTSNAGFCHTGADPDVIHTSTTTVAHLDAPCGAGTGLGGVAFNFGQSSIANSL